MSNAWILLSLEADLSLGPRLACVYEDDEVEEARSHLSEALETRWAELLPVSGRRADQARALHEAVYEASERAAAEAREQLWSYATELMVAGALN